MGTPLAMYVHKDVPDHDRVVDLITVSTSALICSTHIPPSRVFAVLLKFFILFFQKNGGTVANSYSGVSYILGMRKSISRMIIHLTITH